MTKAILRFSRWVETAAADGFPFFPRQLTQIPSLTLQRRKAGSFRARVHDRSSLCAIQGAVKSRSNYLLTHEISKDKPWCFPPTPWRLVMSLGAAAVERHCKLQAFGHLGYNSVPQMADALWDVKSSKPAPPVD